jgi:hypothetical protein
MSAARVQMQIQPGISGFALNVQHDTPLLASTERNLAPVRHRGYTQNRQATSPARIPPLLKHFGGHVRGTAFVVFGGAFFEENPLLHDVHLAHPEIGEELVLPETAGVGASDERATKAARRFPPTPHIAHR